MVEGGGGEFALFLEVDQEVEDLAGIEFGQGRIGVVLGELRCPTEVGFYGTFAKAFEFDEAGVILIPFGGGEVPTN